MRSRSDIERPRTVRFLALTFVALFVGVSPVLSSLVTTNIYVVSPDQPVNEDVYVTSTKGIVNGTISGDLTIFTGDLYIGGTVTGSVQVFSSGTVTVAEGATIGGSLRGAAVNVRIYGDVVNDAFVTAASTVVEEPGVIGRDLIAFGGVVRVEGTVGRDVRGRTVRTVIDGEVGGDIDIATQKMEVGSTAVIGGDVQYRSPVGGSIDSGAQIAGSVKRLPTQSNFIYGVILALANLVGFLGFVVVGLVTLFVARGSGSRAAGAVITNPFKTLLWGLAAVIVTPFATVVIAATLVGLPLALLMVMVMIAGLIIGPIPTVTALGNRLLFKRGGLLGAFVVGAVLWRLGIWLVPVVGGVLFVLALIWGVGAWIVGILATRNSDPVPMALMPASMVPESGVPDDWQAPLAPHTALAGVAVAETDEAQGDDDAGSGVESWDATEEGIDGAEPEETPSVEDRVLSIDVAPAAENPPPLEPLSAPAQDQDDDAARRKAEFDALLDSALSDADDDSTDDSSDDEWGLPTS